MIKLAKKVEGALQNAERGLLVGLLTFMVALAFVQVVLRGAFSAGLLWADTLLRHLVLWVGFLGAAVATTGRRQFAMDALVRKLKPGARRWTRAAVDLTTLLVCIGLLRAGVTFLKDEYGSSSELFAVGGLHVPAWALEAIIPIGFALLAFHTFVRLLEELTGTAPPDVPHAL